MNTGEQLLDLVSRHLGALVIQYVAINPKTGIESEERLASYTGFFVTLGDIWYFVTAGHIFSERHAGVVALQREGEIRVTHCRICDYFRTSSTHTTGIPVDFDALPKFYVYIENEMDFALLELRPFYVEALRANEVQPITESNISAAHQYPELYHRVLGFPDELTKEGEGAVKTWLRPALLAVERLPVSSPLAATKPHMISSKILADACSSPVGLSGGPMFAFTKLEDGTTGYWAIGIQSSWNPTSRTVYAYPLPRAIGIFKKAIESEKVHRSVAREA